MECYSVFMILFKNKKFKTFSERDVIYTYIYIYIYTFFNYIKILFLKKIYIYNYIQLHTHTHSIAQLNGFKYLFRACNSCCSTLQKPFIFPSSTCIDLLWGDFMYVIHGGYFIYVMCSRSISYMITAACLQWDKHMHMHMHMHMHTHTHTHTHTYVCIYICVCVCVCLCVFVCDYSWLRLGLGVGKWSR